MTININLPANGSVGQVYKIMTVDDDTEYQKSLIYSLENLPSNALRLEILTAKNPDQALTLLNQHRDVALVFVDVVMNSESAGFELVEDIRQELGLLHTRIVILTGQPGVKADAQAMSEYDIDDYWCKSEITPGHLSTIVSGNIRTWQQLRQLQRTNSGLERVTRSAQSIAKQRDMDSFSEAVLFEARLIVPFIDQAFCAFIDTENHPHSEDLAIVSGFGCFAKQVDDHLSELQDRDVRRLCQSALEQQQDIQHDKHLVLLLQTEILGHKQIFIFYLHTQKSLSPYEQSLLTVFREHLESAFKNLRYLTRLRQLAYQDRTLGAYNRNWLIGKLKSLSPASYQSQVLITFDIINFTEMGITLGDEFCHEILAQVYHNLHQSFQSANAICHIDSDKFAVLLSSSEFDPKVIESSCFQECELDGREHHVVLKASLVPLSELRDHSPQQLLSIAAKLSEMSRQNNAVLTRYDCTISHAVSRRYSLLNQLHLAFNRKEIYVALQPKVRLKDGQVIGFEALARWQTASGDFISPAEFVPVAETAGMAHRLGLYILERTCEAIELLSSNGVHLPVAFNVSASQLILPDTFKELVQAIRAAKIDLKQLEVEITESESMEDYGIIQMRLQELMKLGLEVSLDDFGTGYSSLSHIYQLAATTLKIDRSFVNRLDQMGSGEPVIAAVVRLGERYGYKVIAEGVETEAQRLQLMDLGCKLGQGYFFAKPMRPEELLNWLADNSAHSKTSVAMR